MYFIYCQYSHVQRRSERKRKKNERIAKRISHRASQSMETLINHMFSSILKIRERGVLNRITEQMLPEMPRCKSPTTFHSARLADVYSAFFILIAGGVSAVSIGIVERIWHKRRQMKETIVRGMRQHRLMPSHLPHLPHLPRFSHFSHLSHLHFRDDRRNDFSLDRDSRSNLTINNECVAANPSDSTQESREQIRQRNYNQERYVHSDEDINRPRFEPKFFNWRRRSNFKRTNWSPFSGLPRTRLGRSQKSRSKDNTVFPFHQ